jgi:hypothetical protein
MVKYGKRTLLRAHERRMKNRAPRGDAVVPPARGWPLDPGALGRNTSKHCRPCGCWMCQEDRRVVPPMRERAFDYPDVPDLVEAIGHGPFQHLDPAANCS